MKIKIVFGRAVLATALVFGSAGSLAFAQTATQDIPDSLAPLAKELGCASKTECAFVFNQRFDTDPARALQLAEKHKAYNESQKEIAKSYQEQVVAKLASVSKENFEEEIVKLAQSIVSSNATLAKKLNVDSQTVKAAQTVVTEVKNAGVNLSVCSKSEDELSVEELKACLKAAKNLAQKKDVVKNYLSDERFQVVEAADKAAGLQEALKNGEYKELGSTMDEIGDKCLKSGSPAICDEIARKFFGEDGVKELQRARNQVQQTESYYKKFSLVTPNGKTITGKDAIGSSCDSAFKSNDVALAEACGRFAIDNGLAKKEDVEAGIKLIKSFSEKGTAVDFDRCRINPESCRDFMPEEYKSQFEAGRKIQEIMTQEMGFDPRECEKGAIDPTIGEKCFQGSKNALSKLEALGAPAAKMVEEIKRHISNGEQRVQATKKFESEFKQAGGPGGCKTPQECFEYCSNPINGAECIAIGAKMGAFQAGDAVKRFEQFNTAVNSVATPFFAGQDFGVPGQFPSNSQRGGQFPGRGPYQGFQPYPPGQGQYPQDRQGDYLSDDVGYFPVIDPQRGYYGNEGDGDGRSRMTGGGPTPECFAAISTGDFVKAKEVCVVSQATYQAQQAKQDYQVRQQKIDSQTKEQEARRYPNQSSREQLIKDCLLGGRTQEECVRMTDDYLKNGSSNLYPPTYPPKPIIDVCPMMATVDSCPSDQEKYQTYFSQECGAYYGCRPRSSTETKDYPTASDSKSHIWRFKDGSTQNSMILNRTDSEYQSFITRVDSEAARGYFGGWKPGAGNSSDWNNFGIPVVVPNPSTDTSTMTRPYSDYRGDASSCPGFAYSRYDRTGARYCQLNSERKCSFMYPAYLTASSYTVSECPIESSGSTQTWNTGTQCEKYASSLSGAHPHGEMVCFGTDERSYVYTSDPVSASSIKSCGTNWIMDCPGAPPAGYQGTMPNSIGGYGSCPAGRNWYTPPGGGPGYCQSSSSSPYLFSSDPAENCRMSGGTWSGSYCNVPSSTPWMPAGGCGSTMYWNGSVCVNNPGSFVSSSSTYCSSGMYWNGSACVSSSPGGMTCPSGQRWDGYACLVISESCSVGQRWDGSACVTDTSPSASCVRAGMYWNGSSCVSSSGSTTGSGSYTANSSCASGYWYTPSDGSGSGYCSSGGSGSASSCPTGQNWNGTSCVSSCPMNQYWNGSACVNSYTSPSTSCGSGMYWNGSACVNTSTTNCPTGQYWSGSSCVTSDSWGTSSPSPSTSCGSGMYWNGSSCVSTCPSSQYWNGSACVDSSSTNTTNTSPSTSCGSGMYWNGSSCVSSGSSGTGSPSPSTSCGSGMYWNGSSCVATSPTDTSSPSPSTSCGSGMYWNGSSCVSSGSTSPPPPSSYLNSTNGLFANLFAPVQNFFRNVFGRR